ncbi:MAG: prepilin-type N-terminal cleavage/methylation domain-containing protein [Candidatus Sericytochromatia bacterium]
MRKNKSGFTMIEIMIASVITFIMLSGVLTTLIASMKASRAQNLAVLAENLANEIVKTEVRNRPFKAATGPSLCGDEDTSGTIAYQLKNNSISVNNNVWNKTFTQNNSTQTDFPLIYAALSKISKDANAVLEIRPINVAQSGAPIYSNSRVKVRAIVKWKVYPDVPTFNEIQVSTIATSSGIFDPSLQPI